MRDGKVVKGVRFRNHRVVGDIVDLAARYCRDGADEIVFYDITASPEGRTIDRSWVSRVAAVIDVPFCVAGGIRSVTAAEDVLNKGADKVSVNSPALERPELIADLAQRFGSQCVVLGVDSLRSNGDFKVWQYTGQASRTRETPFATSAWIRTAEQLGAGEVVLNCMDEDGVRDGYDVEQIARIADGCDIPVIASGGAGRLEHFSELFESTGAMAALAASVFHDDLCGIPQLKTYLSDAGVEVRQ